MSARSRAAAPGVRHLVVVLGDQLDAHSAALDGFDGARDAIWMAEVAGESEHVVSSKVRTALFLSAMRHFRDAQRALGRRVEYVELDAPGNTQTLAGELARALAALRPERVVMVQAGEWRLEQEITALAAKLDVALEVRPDRHFLCTPEEFREHASGRKQLRMEFFYREMRRRHRVLLDDADEPLGGQWNFDHDNRESFGREGPPRPLPAPKRFPPDATTRSVLQLVEKRFARHPGDLSVFDWPVTPEDARRALDDFVEHRLADFGRYQDAIWCGEPWLYHSLISAAMNLKLLDPRAVIAAVERAVRAQRVPLAAGEGFIRQVLGWREYVRGVYWLHMPDYGERNALGAKEPLPAFYWTGDTAMACLRDALGQTLRFGYAHHIQRLMVTGLYSLLLGVDPKRIHEWYLGVYVDAVEWVELPNTLGMSQYADGGVMASKPYVATGKYLQRMSNACASCRFDPTKATGDEACPFTTLYWDFLLRHETLLRGNQRMALQVKNVARLSAAERTAIRARAAAIRVGGGEPPAEEGMLPLEGKTRAKAARRS
ncbi:MAG: cryptochrome/photolyase family protein [Opitutaceae bacterium]